jgi:hypothetical protein
VVGLLGLAAAQPVLRSTSTVEARTDAQALFVIDISRSMLASRSPGASTRLARAREDAVRLRDDLADIPAGVATMTDQILPNLFPVPDRGCSNRQSGRPSGGNPPPAGDSVTATYLGALGSVGTQSFFPHSVSRLVAIGLTDGESRPFDLRTTARQLGHAPGVTPIFIHVWGGDERVFDPGEKVETAYHPDPSSASTLAALAQATGGKAFGEDSSVPRHVPSGLPWSWADSPQGLTVSTTALAPYVALAALLPLLVLLTAHGVAPGLRRLAAARRSSRERAQKVPGQSTEIGAMRGRPTSS